MSPNKQLDSGLDPEKERLKNHVNNQELDDLSLIGRGVMYQVGADWNCIVPRDWLMKRINELGLPRWIAPNEVQPHYAYDRAIKWMREDWLDDYYIEAPRLDNGIEEEHRVTVDMKSGSGHRVWKVRAEVFFPEDECKVEGGNWVQHNLGQVKYDNNTSEPWPEMDDGLDEDHHLYSVWKDISESVGELQRRMEVSHVSHDIRDMMYDASTKYTANVIQLRRAVYLYPAGMGDFLDKMAQLYSEIDSKWKKKGEPVAVRTFEVLDTDDKQEWIQHQVEETLRENLDSILEEAFNELDEGEAAGQVVKQIKKDLGSANETAEVYNTLLDAEIGIEKALEEQKETIADEEKEDLIDRVLSQTDIDSF